MHRGERESIFASPLSSKAKCLTHLPYLLEHSFLMYSDLRDANLLLYFVVEVSLRRCILATGIRLSPGEGLTRSV
jgi:hypothetical protein